MALNQKTALIDKLKFIINRLRAKENNKDWAADLYELSNILHQNPLLVPVIKKVTENYYNQDKEDIKDAHEAVNAIKNVSQKLLHYLSVNQTALRLISHELPILEKVSHHLAWLKIIALKRIFMILYTQDISSHQFLQKIATFDGDQKITLLFIDEDEFGEDTNNLYRLGQIDIAKDFKEILNFGILYDRRLYQQRRTDLEQAGNTYGLFILDTEYQMLDAAINPGKDNAPYENSLDAYNYKDRAERVVEEIICHFAAEEEQKTSTAHQKLDSTMNVSANQKSAIDIKALTQQIWYDKRHKILHIKGYQISFRRAGKGYAILAIITKDIASLTKLWHWDEMFEALECKEPPTNPSQITKRKRSLFRTYENLNKQTRKQTNGAIEKLFIIDMNTISLNLVLFQ